MAGSTPPWDLKQKPRPQGRGSDVLQSPRSVLRDHRGVEVIVQAGAEDMLVDPGAAGRDHRTRSCNEAASWDAKRACRISEIDVEILGLRGPVVAQHAHQESERGFDAATDGPAAPGI